MCVPFVVFEDAIFDPVPVIRPNPITGSSWNIAGIQAFEFTNLDGNDTEAPLRMVTNVAEWV